MDRDTLSMQLDPSMLLHLMQQMQASRGTAGAGGAFPGMPPGLSLHMAGDTPPGPAGQSDSSEDGRSRQYRSGGWELTGPMAGLPHSLIHTPNPVVPLKFEQEPGKWSALAATTTERNSMAQFEDAFVSPAVRQAHCKALEAYGAYTCEEAVSVAQQALAISPICPEAYNVLALAQANSYEEALQHYRKAEELGPKVLQPYCWQEMVEERTCWQRTPFRAYYRGLYGVANTLRKMGRYEESFAAYERLLSADGTWYSWSSYVNVLALYPFVLLGAKGPRAVIEYMRSYSHTDDYFTYISSSVYWSGAYVLADLMLTAAKGTSVRADGAKVTAEDGWAADGLDLARIPADSRGHDYKFVKSRPLFGFCHTFFDAVDYLLGDKAMPGGIPTTCIGSQRSMTAASLAYTTGAQWRSTPSVIERLRKYRNTYEVRALIQDLRSHKLKVDIQEIRHYMTAPGGFHKGALEKETGSTPRVRSLMYSLMDYPDGKEFNKQELKVLKWLIDAGVPITDTHEQRPFDQPLHMACYQGYGPEAVKLLLDAGADPLQHNKQGLTALGMTANQGNWREMQAIFQKLPRLLTANAGAVNYCKPDLFGPCAPKKLSVPEAILMDLFGSTCLPCLAGGPQCMRCGNGIPHSPHADFFKTAEMVIAEAGLRKLSPLALQEMEGAARSSGPGSPWTKLHKFVLRALDKQKKAPAGSKEPASAAAGATSSSAAAATSSSSSGSRKAQAAEQAAGQQPPPGVRQCWGCGMRPGADESLQKCSGCRQALYCSRACQTAAWKAHKVDCKTWQEARACGGSSK